MQTVCRFYEKCGEAEDYGRSSMKALAFGTSGADAMEKDAQKIG